MKVINVDNDILYLINKDTFNNFSKSCILLKDNKPINAELDINNNSYKNIKLVDPVYFNHQYNMSNGTHKEDLEKDDNNEDIINVKNKKEVYLINLGMNYISYYSDKPISLFFTN
jgi:hypothetical protein